MITLTRKEIVKRSGRTLLLAVAVCALAALAPAAASAASSAWVGPSPVKGPFNSCATPGYNSIQEAISVSPAKSTIHVCAGTYKEQVVLSQPDTIEAEAGATLQLPASPANSTTACDVQKPGEYEDQDQFVICGAGKVSISGLTLDSKWTEVNCAKQFYGILVGGGTKVKLSNDTILHAGAEPINGCQQGVALQIGHALNSQSAKAILSNDTIEGYQKNGITIDGAASAKVQNTTVKSAPTEQIATNGIQVSRGATAKITGSTIEGNECNVAGHCSSNPEFNEDATGILFYLASSGSQVKSTTLRGNDYGVYNLLNGEAATTTISNDTFAENRYWGIALDQGSAKLNNNTISGPGNVGIQIVQYNGQEFGAHGTGKGDAVTGMGHCALEGFSDNNPTDHPASLSITKSVSKFSGNAQELCNNNTNGKLTISVS